MLLNHPILICDWLAISPNQRFVDREAVAPRGRKDTVRTRQHVTAVRVNRQNTNLFTAALNKDITGWRYMGIAAVMGSNGEVNRQEFVSPFLGRKTSNVN